MTTTQENGRLRRSRKIWKGRKSTTTGFTKGPRAWLQAGTASPRQRAVYTGARGTKRPESSHETPPNAKRRKTNKGGGGHDGTAGKLVVKRKDSRGQNTSDQHRGQEDFWKKFHDALNDLKARGRALRGDEKPTEGTQEDPQAPGPKGL